MSNFLKRIYYEITIPRTNLLTSLLFLFSLVITTGNSQDVNQRVQNSLIIVEVIFPMIALLVTANLLVIERENQTIEFVAVRRDLSEFWIFRILGWLLWILFILIVELIVLDNLYVNFGVGKLLFAAVGPALSLVGLGSFLAILSQDVNIGYLGASLWWGFCLLAPSSATAIFGRHFYLFYGLFISTSDWSTNKISLLCIGVLLLIACGLYIKRNRGKLIG